MQFLLLLLASLAASVSCHGSRYGSGGSPTGAHHPPLLLKYPLCHLSRQVDSVRNGRDYHYSWCHDNDRKYRHADANRYCAKLGPGWQGVSIGSRAEDDFISGVVGAHNLPYIWTSGTKTYAGWQWASGEQFYDLNWSHTGADGLPQPDNRENGNEACHSVINNFYNDGIKWHDIGCHHEKPIICERASARYH